MLYSPHTKRENHENPLQSPDLSSCNVLAARNVAPTEPNTIAAHGEH